MEIKKALNVDLENLRSTHWIMGCLLAFSLLFVAFEWTRNDISVVNDDIVDMSYDDTEMVPITQPMTKVTPPPAAAPKMSDEFKLVPNTTELPEKETLIPETAPITSGTSETTGTTVETPMPPAPTDEPPIVFAEVMPIFPGGMEACMKWLQQHINYPSVCVDRGIHGRVICQFVVNKDGTIVDVKVVKGVDPYLDKEAERVLKMMPKWIPGKQQGRAVRVKFTLPVQFRLG